MVWGAFSSFNKCYLVLVLLEKRTAKDFVDVIYESGLEPYYYHHNNYKRLILVEDGAPMCCSHAPKHWGDVVGMQRLQLPSTLLDLNPIGNIWKQFKD